MERQNLGTRPALSKKVNEVNGGLIKISKFFGKIPRKLDPLPLREVVFIEPKRSRSTSDNLSQAHEVVRLADENTKLRIEVSKLRGILTQTGRPDSVTDDSIARLVLELKNGVFQFVRNHMSRQVSDSITPRGSSPDLTDLIIQSKLASTLYTKLFSENAPIFGIPPLVFWEPYDVRLREFEMQLKKSDCNEDEVRKWRATTLRLSEKLGHPAESSESSLDGVATSILQNLRIEDTDSPCDNAITELTRLCETAYELATKFRSSSIEYKWEQDMEPPIDILPDDNSFEVVGIEGAEDIIERTELVKVVHIVFGGVVRGDKTTGKFRDGTVRLLRSSVVKLGVY